MQRIVVSALHRAEDTLFDRISGRLSAVQAGAVRDLIDAPAGELGGVGVPVLDLDEHDAGGSGGRTTAARVGLAGPQLLGLIRSEPGAVSLESMLTEIDKLLAIRQVDLPEGLFDDVAPRVLAGWRGQAMVESPSHLRAHRQEKTVTLLAALLHARHREVTDALVDLLIATVHRIGARAERKVTEELVNAFTRVTGKENVLFSIADAALAHPDGAVREVVFPAVSGGEQTLRELVHEYKTKGPVYQRTVRTTLRASYTNHYRRGLIRLLDVLEFRSSNIHRPVLDALGLIGRHAGPGNHSYNPRDEPVPVHPGLGGDWEALIRRSSSAVAVLVPRIPTLQPADQQRRLTTPDYLYNSGQAERETLRACIDSCPRCDHNGIAHDPVLIGGHPRAVRCTHATTSEAARTAGPSPAAAGTHPSHAGPGAPAGVSAGEAPATVAVREAAIAMIRAHLGTGT